MSFIRLSVAVGHGRRRREREPASQQGLAPARTRELPESGNPAVV